ncbi:MAG: cyclic nucleotide-binding domain-containing protein [Deltaproteobacteria bacterium]|nr:cyclic nucleotide-binding domain-containing protein [Deltaproteobacteria bacterium]
MKVIAVGKTDVGRKRGHNEDYIVVDPEMSLYMVCDGMGGHAAGEVASETAARTVKRWLVENRERITSFDDTGLARDGLIRLVEEAIQLASREVYGVATSETGKAGMGTTLTMVLCTKTIGIMGHVGDTRLYLRRGGRTYQLSEDHTYVNEMVRRGLATADQAKKGPYSNVITRAVGIQQNVRPDTLLFDILPGDTLLLCSDGLSKYVDSLDELGNFMDGDHQESVPGQLIDIANSRGGADNISAIVLRAEGESKDDATDRSRTTEVNLKIDTLRHVVIFRHLDMSELCKVLSIVRAIEVEKGEIVMREGEASDALYAILDGRMQIERGGAAVKSLLPGEHFGEMALFNSRPRSATVTALTRGKLLLMERGRFNELIKKEPQLGVKLLWCFAQVLSLRLDDASGLLYGSQGSAGFEAEVTSPFKP